MQKTGKSDDDDDDEEYNMTILMKYIDGKMNMNRILNKTDSGLNSEKNI